MKKIVIIPDSFKETMSSKEVGEIIKEEALASWPEVEVIRAEVADGGEGSVEAFLSVLPGNREYVTVSGPYGEPVTACYGMLGETAVIEMAAAFLGARLQSGIDVVLETIHFDKMLEDCSLVITGEGKIDGQSMQGKVVSGVARRAAKKNVPVLVVVGAIDEGAEAMYDAGVSAIFSINQKPLPFEAIQDRTKSDLRKTVQFSDLQRGQNK